MEMFITKIMDERLHRITIDKEVWDRLKLERGTYIKVSIEKVRD